MAAGSFEKTNLDWQIHQIQQRIDEWTERLLSRVHFPGDNTKAWDLPEQFKQTLFWLMLLGFVGWALWQLYQLLQPYWQRIEWSRSFKRQTAAQVEIERSIADWLEQAQRARQQENYREACRALYMAMLQRLNDQNLIRQEPSRTDGEYLSLMQMLDRPLQPYQVLIGTHEQICFGDRPISLEMFDRCWQAYQEIDPA